MARFLLKQIGGDGSRGIYATKRNEKAQIIRRRTDGDEVGDWSVNPEPQREGFISGCNKMGRSVA